MAQLTTTQHMTQHGKDTLEALIDGSSLEEVLGHLTDICYEKAEHLRSNWQDIPGGRAWDHAGNVISKASASKYVTAVS